MKPPFALALAALAIAGTIGCSGRYEMEMGANGTIFRMDTSTGVICKIDWLDIHDTSADMREAGFSDDEVNDWAANQLDTCSL